MGHRPVPPGLRPERHPKLLQKFPRFVVGPGGRHNRDVHSPNLIDLRIIDFWKDQLIAQTQCVVSPSVKGLRGNAAKIADAGKRSEERRVGKEGRSRWEKW